MPLNPLRAFQEKGGESSTFNFIQKKSYNFGIKRIFDAYVK